MTNSKYPEDYLYQYLETSNRVLLDGGCGLGSTTLFLCQRISAEGGKGQVIAIDTDSEDLSYARERLGNLNSYVQFVNGDLASIPSVGSASIDHAFLVNTIAWFENEPLKTVKVMSELSRIIKPGGRLSIWDQVPYIKAEDPSDSLWNQVWEVQKLIRTLQGQGQLIEISPVNLASLLELVGFATPEWKVFLGESIPMEATLAFVHRLMDRSKSMPSCDAQAVSARLEYIVKKAKRPTDMSPATFVMHTTLL